MGEGVIVSSYWLIAICTDYSGVASGKNEGKSTLDLVSIEPKTTGMGTL
jgi:hypothetical protein